jgi:exosortase/archaeosortase family protein
MLVNPPAEPVPLSVPVATRRDPEVTAVARRTAVVVVATVACYHVSLWTLLRGVTVDTPMAYLGLVPIIAAAMGWSLSRPKAGEPAIHDRHIDRIIGVPLVLAALAALVLLPARMSTMYWLYRIDLLTMPLFVAGVICLVFGVRMLWRTKVAVLFLFLAWPIPIRAAVTLWLEPLTNITAAAVRMMVKVVPVASVSGGDGITFQIPHAGASGPFQVQVASACSGANGLLGFLLVASAFALVAKGSAGRKMAWLVVGSMIVFAFNVVRIMAILVVGRFFGETASIDVLHPVAGLITFNIAVLIMVLNAHRFGLSLPRRTGVSRTKAVLAAVPNARIAIAGLLVVAAVGSVFNANLLDYDPISSSVGTPRVGEFAQVALKPEGFTGQAVSRYEHGKRFFGEDSTWVRYQYAGYSDGPLRSEIPVLADVINSGNLQSFSDFGVEACYRFHGYSTAGVKRVDLGNGVVGTVMNWVDPDELAYTALYWVWAVRQGDGIRYERVVLLLQDDGQSQVTSPPLRESVARQLGLRADEAVRGSSSGDDGDVSERQIELRSFLVQFGRQLVDTSAIESAKLPETEEFGG